MNNQSITLIASLVSCLLPPILVAGSLLLGCQNHLKTPTHFLNLEYFPSQTMAFYLTPQTGCYRQPSKKLIDFC